METTKNNPFVGTRIITQSCTDLFPKELMLTISDVEPTVLTDTFDSRATEEACSGPVGTFTAEASNG
jgi:hypothetical protein